ncbi:hypothetical protein HOY34_07630 [Xinfangfangia sp. D13-10-4-6]|uniref:hypothetical protein n=1 Tax=Pseudogemmobacter hezensis TaxID=2737662 RepID=UPI0015571217|nr:hypothetical protein [Pseudogemmobacter hezensis]NPD15073.1 hypothetical protein [Pseudogemmobacter hezensis]
MTKYTVKIGFWLRAYEGFTVEAASDAEAIAQAKAMAATAMESTAPPEFVEFEERREGVIAFIDQITADDRRVVAEDVEFDTDRIHSAPAG